MLTSGASHDAQMINRITPVAMIFVPSRAGLSHVPEEWTEPAQLAVGTDLLLASMLRLDARAALCARGLRHTSGRCGMRTVVRGGTLVTPQGLVEADLLCGDGVVEAWVDRGAAVEADERVDATGLLVFPGFIDPHVHSRDPGNTHKETFHHSTLGRALWRDDDDPRDAERRTGGHRRGHVRAAPGRPRGEGLDRLRALGHGARSRPTWPRSRRCTGRVRWP